MSDVAVLVPMFSPNDQFVLVTRCLKKTGERVKEGEIIAEVEATKTQSEILSPAEGFITWLITEGEQVCVGSTIAQIGQDNKRKESKDHEKKITRKALKLIKENGLDLSLFENLSTIKEKDVRSYLEKQEASGALSIKRISQSFSKLTEIRLLEKSTGNQFSSDVSVMVSLKDIHKAIQKDGSVPSIGVGEFITYCFSQRIQHYPELNGFFDNGAWGYNHFNAGVLINGEYGLKSLTIPNINEITLSEFNQKLQELYLKYLRNELRPVELGMSTFTVSSMFHLGVIDFTPVLNFRQSSILAICAPDPAGYVKIKLVFDHRLVDGLRAFECLKELIP